MKITRIVYHDEKLGKEADIENIINWIEDENDIYDIIKDIFDRFNNGWSNFEVIKHEKIDALGFNIYIIISFRRRKEWKYIQLGLLKRRIKHERRSQKGEMEPGKDR